jgi:hypothetical protein
MFGSMPVQSFPTPDFGGTPWNLLGPYTPKPKPTPTPTPTPTTTCNGISFAGHCFGNHSASPAPSAPVPSNPFPSPSLPNATPTAFGKQRSTIG